MGVRGPLGGGYLRDVRRSRDSMLLSGSGRFPRQSVRLAKVPQVSFAREHKLVVRLQSGGRDHMRASIKLFGFIEFAGQLAYHCKVVQRVREFGVLRPETRFQQEGRLSQ